jgi:serine/threonine protein kinase
MGDGARVVASPDEWDGLAMSDAHWDRVKEVLHQAMLLPPTERDRFLDEACAGDDAIRAEVASLLKAEHDIPSGFLDSPPLAPDSASLAIETLAADQVVAQRYLLVRMLGEGGMGQVWLAEQTEPVRRQVALKLIRAGMYDEAVAQRFKSERQSLAIMDHPAIAKVFDAGATPQGQPYFVMEYVPGLPITEYCDQKRFDIRERLELFIQACEGVQHAHQKAIIHRDLKPANILVVEVDGKPVPRIIDFGIAKATNSQSADQAMHTRFGHFLGTPGYMSPEQLDPQVRDVDTRSDVYTLGVILYVLLTGSLPFEGGGPQQPLHEFLRRVREDDPPTPSAKVGADLKTSTQSAQARGTQARQLAKLLRGDLDWIAMKALERDRARRYATPTELTADLRRYLSHEPVVARPASAAYRLFKYARRHRVAIAVAASLVMLLSAFSVLEGLELRRTTQERDRANHERDRATRITDFMVGMFETADPRAARSNTITVREVLDKASTNIGTVLGKDPDVQADMMFVMGRVYEDLGLYDKAELLFSNSHDIRLHAFGPASYKTLEAQTKMGWEFYMQHRHFREAEALLRKSLGESRSALGPRNATTVAAMQALCLTLMEEGQLVEAERLARLVLDIDTRTLPPGHRNISYAMMDLASVLTRQKRLTEAERLYRQVLQIDRQIDAPEYPDVLAVKDNLARLLADEERLADSEKLYREVVDSSRRILGPEHPVTLFAVNDLADTLSDEGHYQESETLNRQVLDIRRRVYGPDDPITARSIYNLACLAALAGRHDEALSLLSEAVEHGFSTQDTVQIENDADLKSLHGNARFERIVADAKRRAEASR